MALQEAVESIEIEVEPWELWFLGTTLVLSIISGWSSALVRQRRAFVWEGIAAQISMVSLTITMIIFVVHSLLSDEHQDMFLAVGVPIGLDVLAAVYGGFLGLLLGRQHLKLRPDLKGEPIDPAVAEQPLWDWIDDRQRREETRKRAELLPGEPMRADEGSVDEEVALQEVVLKDPLPPRKRQRATTVLVVVVLTLIVLLCVRLATRRPTSLTTSIGPVDCDRIAPGSRLRSGRRSLSHHTEAGRLRRPAPCSPRTLDHWDALAVLLDQGADASSLRPKETTGVRRSRGAFNSIRRRAQVGALLHLWCIF